MAMEQQQHHWVIDAVTDGALVPDDEASSTSEKPPRMAVPSCHKGKWMNKHVR